MSTHFVRWIFEDFTETHKNDHVIHKGSGTVESVSIPAGILRSYFCGLIMRTKDGQEICILLENLLCCCEKWGVYIYSSLDSENQDQTVQLNGLLDRLLESNVININKNSSREQRKNRDDGHYQSRWICVDVITDRETFHIDLTNNHNEYYHDEYYHHSVYLKWKDFEDDFCL